MTFFYINTYGMTGDDHEVLNHALTALAGLPIGYIDTVIAAHEDSTNAIESWCDDWRDENADRLDAFDFPEPEDQPEYEIAVDAARQEAIDEHHVTSEQLMHMLVIVGWGADGVAELRARNEMFWAIAEHHHMAIDG
ncbi:hypothetical protein [Paraburkholderia tropica]|uniref:hypothetical protein n=1 Tax=Paraburkholderia tropica TaxID=92647 RepID=UPI0031E0572E